MSHLTGKKAQAMLLDATCPAPTRTSLRTRRVMRSGRCPPCPLGLSSLTVTTQGPLVTGIG